jgi:ATP-dependent exoDNAse (exonuclease V) beta subunit
LNFWDKNAEKFSIPSPEGNNAVRIMTIHKSKGLEFPVIILLRKKIIVENQRINYGLAGMDFGLPKVCI